MAAIGVFFSGLMLSMGLIMAIGPQNVHVLRVGLARQYLGVTAIVSIVADMVLISLGVWGLAQLGELPPKIYGAMIGAGMLFLFAYGLRAWGRFWRGWRTLRRLQHLPADSADTALAADAQAQEALPTSTLQAVGMALAFSWLNPHAWIDTTALIGTASLAYGTQATLFGLGAMTGSIVWFSGLSLGAWWLGQRLRGPRFWMWLDGAVALLMWALSLMLGSSLLE